MGYGICGKKDNSELDKLFHKGNLQSHDNSKLIKKLEKIKVEKKTSYKAIRSYKEKFYDTNKALNEHLEKGWEVIHITPFISKGETEFLEYILKSPTSS